MTELYLSMFNEERIRATSLLEQNQYTNYRYFNTQVSNDSYVHLFIGDYSIQWIPAPREWNIPVTRYKLSSYNHYVSIEGTLAEALELQEVYTDKYKGENFMLYDSLKHQVIDFRHSHK